MVAAPLNHRAYNKEKDENMDKMRKRRFLQKVEGISVIKKAAKSQNSKEEKLKRELWETMIATFMNNIQLQIHRQEHTNTQANTHKYTCKSTI